MELGGFKRVFRSTGENGVLKYTWSVRQINQINQTDSYIDPHDVTLLVLLTLP